MKFKLAYKKVGKKKLLELWEMHMAIYELQASYTLQILKLF